MARPIGTLGTIPSLTIGGRVYTDLATLIILQGVVNTSGNPTTLRRANATTGYQAVNTLTITSIVFYVIATGAQLHFGYSDTDYGINNGGGVTGTVFYMSDSFSLPFVLMDGTAPTHTILTSNIDFQVPATKYPFISPVGSTSDLVIAYGYDV